VCSAPAYKGDRGSRYALAKSMTSSAGLWPKPSLLPKPAPR
jgi:hypothetical protein